MRSRLAEKRIAFVTSSAYAGLTASDRIAADVLRAESGHVIPAIWDDASVEWASFDAIIIRSPWDYHLHAARFRAWIDSLERKGLPVWNPATILRRNMDKRYLLDLEKEGIPIPRTHFLEAGGPIDPTRMSSLLGTHDVVIKPAVSASGWNTWRCSLKEFSAKDHKRLKDLQAATSVMIQEYMPEIASEGEWSLIFFGEQFSHAVRKYPGKGDFRVQEELGGRHRWESDPPADLIRQAGNVLAAIDGPLLYARIDGIVRSKKLRVMELELVEPSLYFDVDPPAAGRFSERLVELIWG